jgi:hypothetical protein
MCWRCCCRCCRVGDWGPPTCSTLLVPCLAGPTHAALGPHMQLHTACKPLTCSPFVCSQPRPGEAVPLSGGPSHDLQHRPLHSVPQVRGTTHGSTTAAQLSLVS